LSSTRQANQHHVKPAGESAGQPLNRVFERYTRRNWLKKVDADLNQGLRALLQQIDVDRREITRGLDPINAVLAGVPFRHDSHLAIEPVDHPNSNLQEFRKVVLALAGITRWGRTCSTTRPRSRPPSGGYARAWDV
jgi:hypothetical protein